MEIPTVSQQLQPDVGHVVFWAVWLFFSFLYQVQNPRAMTSTGNWVDVSLHKHIHTYPPANILAEWGKIHSKNTIQKRLSQLTLDCESHSQV